MRKYKLTSIRKFGIFISLFSLVISIAGIAIYHQSRDIKQYKPAYEVNILKELRSQYIVETDETEQKQKINNLNKLNYDIKLSNKYQNLVYYLCKLNNISYELALAIMFKESEFNIEALNINTNRTKDYGLYQLNNAFISSHRENAIKYCELPENISFNIKNPDHNIRAGVGNIVYLRNYYKDKGVSENELLKYISNSVNMGVTGYARYIKQTGMTSRSYSKQVGKYKEILEVSHTIK